MIAHTSDLTLRQARALIRKQVRQRLDPYRGKDIWNMPFFIERLDLASEAYEYQTARKPDGTVAEIDELIGFVRDELADFVLLEDSQGQYKLTDRRQKLVCEECSDEYEISGHTRCPKCGHPNLYQTTEMELHALVEQVNLGADDPIARHVLAATEPSRIEIAYSKIVTCFEMFHRSLNELVSARTGSPTIRLPRPNLFQNVEDTRKWFAEHYNLDVFQVWSPGERRLIEIVFNKRHILAHRGGIKDRQYIDRTGGGEDEIGKPVDTRREEILEAIGLVRLLVRTARESFPLKGL